MEVEKLKYFRTVLHDYDTFKIELISFICQCYSSPAIMTDHDSYKWINTKDLSSCQLAPADVPIAQALVAEGY